MEEEVELPGWVHYHGPASPRLLADEVFPAARGLITLSQHAEGRPQVLLEAMAASLPIVASAMPAHASIVAPGETGLICHSTGQMAAALDRLDIAAATTAFREAGRRKMTH